MLVNARNEPLRPGLMEIRRPRGHARVSISGPSFGWHPNYDICQMFVSYCSVWFARIKVLYVIRTYITMMQLFSLPDI